MPKIGTERGAVQNTLIKYACEVGWTYVNPEEAERLRGGRTGLIFKRVFADQLQELNDFIDSIMIEEKIKELERLPARKEGNLQAWEYLKGLKTVFLQKENREKNVKIIEYDYKKKYLSSY